MIDCKCLFIILFLNFVIENENRGLVFFFLIIVYMVKYIVIYIIWNILFISKIKGVFSSYGVIVLYFLSYFFVYFFCMNKNKSYF